MKIILAPDSFKGSLSAAEAATALAAGIRHVCPDAELVCLPLADGGEGTVDALVRATQGRTETATVSGPLGFPLKAAWGRLGPGGGTAVVEMAAAAGLTRLAPKDYAPQRTTTHGVGELLRGTVDAGATQIILGLGGSATSDGGAGALQALGIRFLDAWGNSLPEKLGGGDLIRLARIDTTGLRFPVGDVPVTLASDVTNPLLGPQGASAVYGPQKGADARAVAELEAALTNYAAVIERDLGIAVGTLPGGGAAGGLGAGMMAFLGAEVRSGIDLVLEMTGFSEKARGADWVFTGEGRIDAQTLHGKTISGLLRRCQALDIPVLAFGGSVEEAASEALSESGLRAAFPIVSGPMPLEDAMRDGAALLAHAAARVMRILSCAQAGGQSAPLG